MGAGEAQRVPHRAARRADGGRHQQSAQPRRHILGDTARSSIAAGALTAPSIQPRSERQQTRRSERNLGIITGPSVARSCRFRREPGPDRQGGVCVRAGGQELRVGRSGGGARRSRSVRAGPGRVGHRAICAEVVAAGQPRPRVVDGDVPGGKNSLLEVLEVQAPCWTRGASTWTPHDAAIKISELERVVGLPWGRWWSARCRRPTRRACRLASGVLSSFHDPTFCGTGWKWGVRGFWSVGAGL